MNATAKTALWKSIQHWDRLLDLLKSNDVQGVKEEGWYTSSCALCQEFLNPDPSGEEGDCTDCPVQAHTGQSLCEGSPWRTANRWLSDYTRFPAELNHKFAIDSVREEVEFLTALYNEQPKSEPDPATYRTPLLESIEHWKRLLNAVAVKDYEAIRAEGFDCNSCALCLIFLGDDCQGCPVREDTGKVGCHGTPYHAAAVHLIGYLDLESNPHRYRQTLINTAAELEYLTSLIPKE